MTGEHASGMRQGEGDVERDGAEEVLLSRIVDARASEAEWSEFRGLASGKPGLWKTLALMQHDSRMLEAAVKCATQRLGMKDGAGCEPSAERRGLGHLPGRSAGWGALQRRLGWAAAALIGLAWAGTVVMAERSSRLRDGGGLAVNGGGGLEAGGVEVGAGGDSQAGPGAVLPTAWRLETPDDALRAYVEIGRRQGRVLGELPRRQVVRTMPARDHGGVDVMYLRQFVERGEVRDVVGIGRDEAGRAVPVPGELQYYPVRMD